MCICDLEMRMFQATGLLMYLKLVLCQGIVLNWGYKSKSVTYHFLLINKYFQWGI